MALLTLIWGTTWAAIRICLEGIPPLTGVALRFALAGALLWGLARARGVTLGAIRHERWLWVVNALLTFAGSYGIVFWGEQWVPSGLAAILFATFPLWTAAFGPLWLPGVRLRPLQAMGLVLGFAGVAVIFFKDLARAGDARIGKAAAVFLLAPLLSAIANLLVKRFGGAVSPLSIAAVPMMLGALAVAPLALLVEHPATAAWTGRSLAALAYLAVAGSALAFTVYYWLLRRRSALLVSLINYTVPVVAVAVGALTLGERFGAETLAGAAMVLAGVSLAVAMRQGKSAGPAIAAPEV